MAAWTVGTANAGDYQNDSQQDYHADDDPGYFYPTWHAGVSGGEEPSSFVSCGARFSACLQIRVKKLNTVSDNGYGVRSVKDQEVGPGMILDKRLDLTGKNDGTTKTYD
ncbi:hypothetical protein [Rhizobium leguminosarum]|uniref:hypothetical protein n=1 Tax=Rhizobium leguminosarum TaxID=384 RepID=UPI001440EC27|nr:hypothetical protein [Rhizobium leguminosarum]